MANPGQNRGLESSRCWQNHVCVFSQCICTFVVEGSHSFTDLPPPSNVLDPPLDPKYSVYTLRANTVTCRAVFTRSADPCATFPGVIIVLSGHRS